MRSCIREIHRLTRHHSSWTSMIKRTIMRPKRAASVLALATVLSAGILVSPASAQWDHIHTIRPDAHLNLCLDVQYNYQNNHTPVWMYGCNGTSAQQWTFHSLGVVNGYERFEIEDPYGFCLDAPMEGGYQWGWGVQIYGCNNQPAQIWDQQPGGLSTWPFESHVCFSLRNEFNGLYLDDAGYGGQGTRAITWGPNWGKNQLWNWPGVPGLYC
jgi:hypothetical protein